MSQMEIVDLSNVSAQSVILNSTAKKPAADSSHYLDQHVTQHAGDSRSLTITGVSVILKDGHRNRLWKSLHTDPKQKNDPAKPKAGLKAVTIVCDTLEVHGALRIPETDVTIYARHIKFATAIASINTSPLNWALAKAKDATRDSNAGNGADGRHAGAFTVNALSVEETGGSRVRLIGKGGDGQKPGNGIKGVKGTSKSGWSTRTFTVKDSGISESTASVSFSPKATYIDYKWIWGLVTVASGKRGTTERPTSGTDARASGRPGSGGNGGSLRTNHSSLVTLWSGLPGVAPKAGPFYRGGAAGTPTESAHYEVKLWHNVFGTKDAKNEVSQSGATHKTSAGKDAPPPAAKQAKGSAGKSTVTGPKNAWTHPLGVRMAIRFARDLFLAGAREELRSFIAPYLTALTAARPANGPWKSAPDAQWASAGSEIISISGNLDAQLDLFGNPAGYTPVLSLASAARLYANETKIALRTMLVSQWVLSTARKLEDSEAALAETVAALNEDTDRAAKSANSAEARIAESTSELDSLNTKLVSLGNKLERLETKLLGQVENKLRTEAQIKFAIRMAAAVAQVIPVGQPALGTVGSLAGTAADFIGDNSSAPDTVSKMGKVISDAQSAAFKAREAKEKIKDWQRKDLKDDPNMEIKEASAASKAMGTMGKGLAPALNQVSEGIKALQVPESEVEAQLQKLQSESPEWQEMVDDIRALNETKVEIFGKLAAALAELSAAYADISGNTASVISMQQARIDANRVLNPDALSSLSDMNQRSLRILQKYLYILVKSYEATVLETYDADWDLTETTKKISQITADPAAMSAGEVNDQIEALESVFQLELQALRKRLLERFDFTETTLPLVLSLRESQTPREVDGLNRRGRVTLNPLRWGLLLPDRQTARLSDVELSEIAIDPDGPPIPKGHNLVVSLRPSQRGILRKSSGLYVMHSQAPIGWQWTVDAAKKIHPEERSAVSDDILNLIIGEGAAKIKQKLTLVPAWSDLELTLSVSPAVRKKDLPRVTGVKFEVKCSSSAAPARQTVLTVQSTGNRSGAKINCTADLGQRAAGFDQMLRIFTKGARVKIQVPHTSGGATFGSWALGGLIDEQPKPNTPSIAFDLDNHTVAWGEWLGEETGEQFGEDVAVTDTLSTDAILKAARKQTEGAAKRSAAEYLERHETTLLQRKSKSRSKRRAAAPPKPAPRDKPLSIHYTTDTKTAPIGVAPNLESVDVLGKTKKKGVTWFNVQFGPCTGWVLPD